MSTLNVDKVDPSTGTALELGTSGDTITVPTGAGLTVVDEVKTNKISPSSGVAFTLGDSGDTFTVPSGATIVNSGTATGFGGANTPSFRVYMSGDQTLADSTTEIIEFDTESWDTNSAWNTGTYRFTVPSGEAGKYQFNWATFVQTLDLNERMIQMLYLNGSSTNFGEVTWHSQGSGNANGTGTVTLALSVADYIDLRIYAQAGTTTTLAVARTFLAGYKLIGV